MQVKTASEEVLQEVLHRFRNGLRLVNGLFPLVGRVESVCCLGLLNRILGGIEGGVLDIGCLLLASDETISIFLNFLGKGNVFHLASSFF